MSKYTLPLQSTRRRTSAPAAGSGMTDWNEPAGEVLERGGRLLEPKQAFRSHHDQRPRRGVERLPAEQVEELARGGAVRDPDVVLRSLLEEALEPRARVLGPVALVAMREQERQP